MGLREEWEEWTADECLHVHETVCGNTFKYFDIEYVKWLEAKIERLQNTIHNSKYTKSPDCGGYGKRGSTALNPCPTCNGTGQIA